MSSKSPLFRQQALDYYIRSQEKSILPRIARPPVFLLLWLLLALAVTAILLVWLGQVPIYVSGPGMVVEPTATQPQQSPPTAIALVFFPVTPGQSLPIHAGDPVRLQIGTQEPPLITKVAQVGLGILSPLEIEQRYAPGSAITARITGPSLIVTIHLSSTFASQTYAGSTLTAQIQIGTTSILSSLLGATQGGSI